MVVFCVWNAEGGALAALTFGSAPGGGGEVTSIYGQN